MIMDRFGLPARESAWTDSSRSLVKICDIRRPLAHCLDDDKIVVIPTKLSDTGRVSRSLCSAPFGRES